MSPISLFWLCTLLISFHLVWLGLSTLPCYFNPWGLLFYGMFSLFVWANCFSQWCYDFHGVLGEDFASGMSIHDLYFCHIFHHSLFLLNKLLSYLLHSCCSSIPFICRPFVLYDTCSVTMNINIWFGALSWCEIGISQTFNVQSIFRYR